MRTSRKLSQIAFLLFALLVLSASAFAADPGLVYPPESEVSDQKAGSILVYNFYTSSASGGNTQNTRINITNTSVTSAAFVHLFFVSDGCGIADSYICLTANQTASFLASDVDPGISGYIIAVAVDGDLGCPVAHNSLIGDLYVKLSTGHAANLGAEAFSALFSGLLPLCDATSNAAVLRLGGTAGEGYNRLPRTLAISNIPSRADGNDTLVILNRISGNLAVTANTIGTLFGLLYDDAETAISFSVSGPCQLRFSWTGNNPRTAPRFDQFIPAGRSGWAKFYNQTADNGMLGAVINFNPNAGSQANAFNGGHNLHKLTLVTGDTSNNWLTIPVFPPSC